MTLPSFKDLYNTARTQSSYAMQKSVADEMFRRRFYLDYDRTRPYGVLPIMGPNALRKAIILGDTDYNNLRSNEIRRRYIVGTKPAAQEHNALIDALMRKYPERIAGSDPSMVKVLSTPWTRASNGSDMNNYEPRAEAVPQDYYGSIIHPGDTLLRQGIPLMDYDRLSGDDHYYDEDWRKAVDLNYIGDDFDKNRFGGVFERWDDGSGEVKGYVFRPDSRRAPPLYSQEGQDWNSRNADMAFNTGKVTGINGPKSEKMALALLSKQLAGARGSSNRDTRNLAGVLDRYLPYTNITWYNPGSYYWNGEVSLESPDRMLRPWGGYPGSVPWEEFIHATDNLSGNAMSATGGKHSTYISSRGPSMHSALEDDFRDRFQGDPQKIEDVAEKTIRGWEDPNGGSYADYYEYLELLSLLYQNATGGKRPKGVLGSYVGHPYGRKFNDFKDFQYQTIDPETYNSVLNDRMTDNKTGMERMKYDFPNTEKNAIENLKEAMDFYDDEAKKVRGSEKTDRPDFWIN